MSARGDVNAEKIIQLGGRIISTRSQTGNHAYAIITIPPHLFLFYAAFHVALTSAIFAPPLIVELDFLFIFKSLH